MAVNACLFLFSGLTNFSSADPQCRDGFTVEHRSVTVKKKTLKKECVYMEKKAKQNATFQLI